MSRSDSLGLHRGTDVAIVASCVLGGYAILGVPLTLLRALLTPVPVSGWRFAGTVIGSAMVGSGMIALARPLAARRSWARLVAIVVLAAWAFLIGGFCLFVATDEEAGHGAGYVVLGGLGLGGLSVAGAIGLLTRGAAAEFRSRREDVPIRPPPPTR